MRKPARFTTPHLRRLQSCCAHPLSCPRPLAADFGAPLAYYPEPELLGLMAMFRPEKYENRAGLYLLEPYDPDRIPVILIHGLLSIPQMWVPTISAIESDPQHGRYQFWVFAYPTGDPTA